jgi:YHS domain-containing protein
MRNFGLVVAVLTTSFTLSSVAFVQTNKANSSQTKQTTAKKQEVRCPVTGKVITDTKKAPKLTYQGKTYYFSCQNCLAEFRKNPQKYIQQASNTRTVSNTPAKKEGDACCSGEAKAEGKACCAGEKAEGKACCAGEKAEGKACCADKNAQPAAQVAVNEKLVCPVSGEELKVETAVRVVYDGKVYYVGCENCKAQFLKDPATYAKKAEQTSRLQGKPEQPAAKETTAAPADKLICPVSGEEIEESTAVRFIYNSKVYYTCCNGCKNKFLKDPETYAKKAETISKRQGKPEAETE